jgi:hypothetical protein
MDLDVRSRRPKMVSNRTRLRCGELARFMSSNENGILSRLWRGLCALLPNGGIGDEGPAPDIDGRRDTDAHYRRAVLRTKSQWSSGGQATTSYEPVVRSRLKDK